MAVPTSGSSHRATRAPDHRPRSSCSPRPARWPTAAVTAFVGGDVDDLPRRSASTARRRCTPPATSARQLPGLAVAAAMKAVIDGGDAPDLILFPQNYEGRDVVAGSR